MMAVPVGFEGANQIYYAPKGVDNCRDLEVLKTETQIISCWRLTGEELEQINKTGVVWLSVTGQGTPPVLVSGTALAVVNGRPSRAEPSLNKQ